MTIRMLTVGLLFGCMFALTGCGSGGMTVDGKVTNGGQPYVPSKDGAMSVGLTGEGAGKSFSSKVEDDGTFKIAGVPAGKYDVTATIYPTPESMAKSGKANNAGAGGDPRPPAVCPPARSSTRNGTSVLRTSPLPWMFPSSRTCPSRSDSRSFSPRRGGLGALCGLARPKPNQFLSPISRSDP